MFLRENTKELSETLSEIFDTFIGLDYLQLFSEKEQRFMIILMNQYQRGNEEAKTNFMSLLESKRGHKKQANPSNEFWHKEKMKQYN